MRIKVRVTPKSSRNDLEVTPDGPLKAWVHAPPADGQANEAVISLLAERLSIPKSSVKLVAGATSRNKTFELADLDEQAVAERLGAQRRKGR